MGIKLFLLLQLVLISSVNCFASESEKLNVYHRDFRFIGKTDETEIEKKLYLVQRLKSSTFFLELREMIDRLDMESVEPPSTESKKLDCRLVIVGRSTKSRFVLFRSGHFNLDGKFYEVSTSVYECYIKLLPPKYMSGAIPVHFDSIERKGIKMNDLPSVNYGLDPVHVSKKELRRNRKETACCCLQK
ncbi:MAG: hypothetical protein NXI10_17805 [bacterium]|nr:hypothetical protein [bacterium]